MDARVVAVAFGVDQLELLERNIRRETSDPRTTARSCSRVGFAERLGAIVLREHRCVASARSRSDAIGLPAIPLRQRSRQHRAVHASGHFAANSSSESPPRHATSGTPAHPLPSTRADTFATGRARADSTAGPAPVLRSRDCSASRHRAAATRYSAVCVLKNATISAWRRNRYS